MCLKKSESVCMCEIFKIDNFRNYENVKEINRDDR